MSKDDPTVKFPKENNSGDYLLGLVHLNEDFLQEIIVGSHEGIVIIGDDYKFEYISPNAHDIFGGTSDDLLGKDFRQYLRKETADDLAKRYRSRRKGKYEPVSYPLEITRKDGEKRIVKIRASVLTNGLGKTKTVLHILDITKQEENARALKDSERRYRTLVETMNDGLVIDDENGIIIYANDAFCNLLGYEINELIGKHSTNFIKDIDPEFMDSKIARRREGESERYELDWIHKSGRIIPTLLSANPFFNAKGEFTGTFAVVTEISEQKEAEEAVQLYLDLLTHDIANQLQVIVTSSSLLDETLPSSYLGDAKQDIMDAVERCNRLITKVKRAAQLRTLPISEVEITEIVEEKAKVVERIHSANVKMKGFSKEVYVYADTLFGELVWNLLENAARHNPKPDKKIWITMKMNKKSVVLTVADNGPGISDARKQALFETGKRAGGVGLTLVSQMTRKYNGTIRVEDRVPGKSSEGAKFILKLKRVQT